MPVPSSSGSPSQLRYFDCDLTQVSPFPDNAIADYKLYGDYFLDVMKENLAANQEVIRKFDHLESFIAEAGAAVDSSIRVFTAQSGLTSGYALPVYTNVSNGLGIFDSRYIKKILEVHLSPGAIDELACNNETKSLGFLNSDGVLCP